LFDLYSECAAESMNAVEKVAFASFLCPLADSRIIGVTVILVDTVIRQSRQSDPANRSAIQKMRDGT